jgi:DNA repair photolyase
MAIISASRRTDIPAFYSEWFMNRIREGFLYVQNPFNAHQVRRVDLSPENVDVIVFWTKNSRPLMSRLDELDEKGYRYYFLFTLTGYPKALEPEVPAVDELLSTFRALSQRLGASRVIWRFDPIILSDVTPEQTVIEGFRRLAGELKGATRRVVISFVHLYSSVKRVFERMKEEKGIRFHDSLRTEEQVRRIAAALAEIAHGNSMEIASCAGEYDLSGLAIERGRCIDDRLIARLFGITVSDRKDRYQREQCGCVESQDIGQYNTCTHGCVYCYASHNKDQANRNRALHDPESPFLIGRGPQQGSSDRDQMSLFSGDGRPTKE